MVCLDLNFYICIFGFEFLRQNVFQLHDHFSDIKDFRAENILISFSQTVKPHGYCKRNLSVAGFYNLKCCDFVTLTSLISIVHIFLFRTSFDLIILGTSVAFTSLSLSREPSRTKHYCSL